MKRKHAYSGRAYSLPAGIVIGTSVSIAISIIGCAVLAWLITGERLQQESIGYGCIAILLLASAGGSATAWKLIGHRQLLICGIQTLVYYGILLMTALPFGGQYEGLLVTAVLVALGGALTLIPGMIGSGSGGHRFKKSTFR